MLELEGTLEINRVTSGHEEDYMKIRVIDERSCCVALELRCSMTDLMRALTSSPVRCAIEVNNSGVIGKYQENKEEVVPYLTDRFSLTDADVCAALAPFEVDGWKARRSDMRNMHRSAKTADGRKGALVLFTRHVDTPPEGAKS